VVVELLLDIPPEAKAGVMRFAVSIFQQLSLGKSPTIQENIGRWT